MLKLVPLKGPRGTNLDGYFIDALSPTGRILSRTTSTMAFDEAPKDANAKSAKQQIVEAMKSLSPEDLDDVIKTYTSLAATTHKLDDDTVAEDDEETGDNPNASNKERNALGIDKARRIAADKSIQDHNSFESRYGDRIKIDTMGVK